MTFPIVRAVCLTAALGLVTALAPAAAVEGPPAPGPGARPTPVTARLSTPGGPGPAGMLQPPMAGMPGGMPGGLAMPPLRPPALPGMFSGGQLMMFDRNGDGAISREEFDKAAAEVFAALDANGDRKIEATEIPNNPSFLFNPPPARAGAILRQYDENNDNRITNDEAVLPPKTFARFDKNSDKALDVSELEALDLAQSLLLLEPTRRNQHLLAELDRDRDGKLSAKEFTISPALFKEADRNNDQTLDPAEISTLPPLPPTHPTRLARDLINRYDRDHDQQVSFEETRAVPGSILPFEQIDADKNGQLDLKEVAAWFETTGGRAPRPQPPDVAKMLLDKYDTDQNGKISRGEGGIPDQMFQMWDQDKDGFVDRADIEKVRGSISSAAPPGAPPRGMPPAGAFSAPAGRPDFSAMMKTADRNGDNKLTLEELNITKPTFDKFDANHDGFVTVDEFEAGMNAFHSPGAGPPPMQPTPVLTPKR
jgi:Ca2+-binding EF-hand superfamily protein